MSNPKNFSETFKKLKAILAPQAAKLIVVHFTATQYYLDTRHVMKNRRRVCFGAVRAGRNYVSCHLMPVYAFPKMLESISPELRKRMQGKSCFNFKTVDDKLFKELARLTEAGLVKFNDPSLLEKIAR